jgi:hypothetical protein
MSRFTRWDQRFSVSESNEVLFLLSEAHVARLKEHVVSSEVASLVRERDFRGLCLYELDYTRLYDLKPDEQVRNSRHIRQILAFFQKRKDLDVGIDSRKVAWETARAAEELCLQTNQIFRKYNQGGFFFPLDVESVLFRAQRKICAILGDLPSLEDIKLHFGPGATTQVKKKDASARRKLAQMFVCSEEATGLLPEILAEMPLWSGVSPTKESTIVAVSIHRGRTDFVPKSAKTDRTINVEPMLNSMVQLGIGEHIASRLAKEGVNIRDQTLNQRLAKEGSLNGRLATLDLSSASDTIASGLVESLFPLDWWLFLRSVRTGVATTPDGVARLQKFSSMGNGFTFPLETLLFYSLAYACCNPSDHHEINAYGDDIIVPTYAVPLLQRVLLSCGFLVNRKKSYSEGPFRESCGKDYYSGIDIRPCYIKDSLSGESCFVLHNFYVRTGQPELAQVVLETIDPSLRLFGPDGYGDGHLLGDYYAKPHNRELGWGGYTFETFTHKNRKGFYRLGADYVFPSYSIYVKGDSSGIFPDKVPASRWLRRRSHGSVRPDQIDSTYVKKDGRWYLTDTLPGYQGYKRIKIYVSHHPG